MKRITLVLISILLAGAVSSCNKSKKEASAEAPDTMGKMEVVIPDELKDDPEIVSYIEGMSDVVDGYAILLDETLPKLEGFEGKTFEDLNMREKVKLTSIAAEVSMKSAPLMTKWAELQAKQEGMLDDELTDEELLAFGTLMDRFEERMVQIQERNQKFFEGAQ